MRIKNYPLNHFEKTSIGFSLNEQYTFIRDSLIDIKPEWSLNLISIDSDLSEFHHILWLLPFYKKTYKLKTVKTMWSITDVYCAIVDSSNDILEICTMKVWYLTHTSFIDTWKVSCDTISSRENKFNALFLELLDNPSSIPYGELPIAIQKNYLLDW